MKKNKRLVFGTAAVAVTSVLIIGLLVRANLQAGSSPEPGGTTQKACTEEALLCPDGSAVGREGPNCEFPDCPDAPAVLPQS